MSTEEGTHGGGLWGARDEESRQLWEEERETAKRIHDDAHKPLALNCLASCKMS